MNLKQIRWTMEQASSEFGINPRTLSARIKQLDIIPGKDRCYSTKQIATAVYGDLERERIRLTSAEADAQERENLGEIGKLIDVEIFKKDYAPVYVGMVRVIESSKLSDADKDAIRLELANLHKPNSKTQPQEKND